MVELCETDRHRDWKQENPFLERMNFFFRLNTSGKNAEMINARKCLKSRNFIQFLVDSF
jgi:hypothetical protein